MSNYRRSGNDYGYDDYGGGGGGGGNGNGSQRWDRDRFERMSRTRGPRSSDSYQQYDDNDRYYGGNPGDDRKVRVEIEEDRRGSYGRSGGNYYDDERYSTPRRSRPDYAEDDRYQGSSSRELAPFNRDYERDYEGSGRRPQRPAYTRRQSSLDTHDRRPIPRYGDQERSTNVNLSVQPRQYREYDYSSSGQDSYPRQDYYAEEDYRDVSIRREKERSTYRRWDDQNDQYEEQAPSRQSYQNKRGRTRMPKRLVHRNAILQMGYPFEEQEDFYIVRTALGKDQIDEVIKISESYFRESSTSIRVDESRMISGPEAEEESESNEIIETTTTKIIENPTEEDFAKYGQGGGEDRKQSSFSESQDSQYRNESQSRPRGRSTTQETYEERDIEESYTQNENQNQIVLPERRKERDIKAEIKALEAERRALRQGRESRDQYEIAERSPENNKQTDYEVADSSKEREVYVEKDSRERGKFIRPRSPNNKDDGDNSRSKSSRRPNRKVVDAFLFSLT